MVKKNEGDLHRQASEFEVCPLCHSLLHSKFIAPLECDRKLLTEIENLTGEDN